MGKKKKIKVKAGGINGFLDEFSDAEESSSHNEKLVQASRNSARLLLGLRYNSASRSMGEGQQQSLCFMSHPPPPLLAMFGPNFPVFQPLDNSLQPPNFIFYSQILSHIILYIALGP